MSNKNIINLAKTWSYKLDYEDRGLEEMWYLNELENQGFTIPGTTSSNNIGDNVLIEKKLTKEAVKSLRQKKKYVGALWLQSTFVIHNKSDTEALYLYLERIIFKSSVWIDQHYVGDKDSLSTAHIYDITNYVKRNQKHTITIRIDNRDIQNIGPYASAYTEETQTIWNGITGKVVIEKKPLQNIQNLIIGLSNSQNVYINFDLSCNYKNDIKGNVTIDIKDKNDIVETYEDNVLIEALKNNCSLNFQLSKDIKLWDEFNPYLYDIKIVLDIDGDIVTLEKKIGFRFFDTRDGTLKINGIPRFLRGNIDCCIYPLTGYPPTDKEEWIRIFNIHKNYGLNHIRFHSWCPPEEAFCAADETGIYLQVEAPMWMDTWTEYAVGSFEEHYEYLPREAENIIKSYSYHPSFCIFSNGNELNGDFNLLENIIANLKRINPHILYTLTSNWDRKINKQDDVFISQSVDNVGIRGQYFLDKMVESSLLNFAEGASNREVPVISHEVGQYVVYPDVRDINKYTGVLNPTNFQVIKEDLEEKKLLKYVDDYVKASGRLSISLYKAELEAAIRTKNMSGIQLLGLHDFTGQSTATIGLLDVFYDSKDIISPEDFKCFCDSLIPLLNFEKFKYSTLEEIDATIAIANYTKEVLNNVDIKVSLIKSSGEIIFDKVLNISKLPIGVSEITNEFKGEFFKKLRGRNKCTLKIEILKYSKVNSWDIWVYEPMEDIKINNFYEEVSDELIEKLKKGESAILCPKPHTIKNIGPSCYFPVFWSPVHFASKDPCGIVINTSNSLFKDYFQTDIYGNLEWKNFLENSSSINIDELKNFEPLTLLVPNFFNNHKFTNMFEAKVDNGKLLVCLFDFNNKQIEAKEFLYLKEAFKKYISSEEFAPSQELKINTIKELFSNKQGEWAKEDIALYKPVLADSEKSKTYGACKGNDNNPSTCWLAADAEDGHYWQVDLGEVYNITGNKIIFNEEANYMYVIHCSLDGQSWNLIVNKTGQVVPQKIHNDKYNCEARYLKITYNSLPSGIWAGHKQFSVYKN